MIAYPVERLEFCSALLCTCVCVHELHLYTTMVPPSSLCVMRPSPAYSYTCAILRARITRAIWSRLSCPRIRSHPSFALNHGRIAARPVFTSFICNMIYQYCCAALLHVVCSFSDNNYLSYTTFCIISRATATEIYAKFSIMTSGKI